MPLSLSQCQQVLLLSRCSLSLAQQRSFTLCDTLVCVQLVSRVFTAKEWLLRCGSSDGRL